MLKRQRVLKKKSRKILKLHREKLEFRSGNCLVDRMHFMKKTSSNFHRPKNQMGSHYPNRVVRRKILQVKIKRVAVLAHRFLKAIKVSKFKRLN